jgi:hypothetical protein
MISSWRRTRESALGPPWRDSSGRPAGWQSGDIGLKTHTNSPLLQAGANSQPRKALLSHAA